MSKPDNNPRHPTQTAADFSLPRGLFVYAALNGLIWVVIFISGGRIEPREYDLKEYWTWRPSGEKPWLIRQFTKDRFWEDQRRPRRQPDGIMLADDNSSSGNRSPRISSPADSEEKGVAMVTSPQHAVLRD